MDWKANAFMHEINKISQNFEMPKLYEMKEMIIQLCLTFNWFMNSDQLQVLLSAIRERLNKKVVNFKP